jgi:hypothetical protein
MSKAVLFSILAGLLFCAAFAAPVLALDAKSSAPAVNAGTLKKSSPTKLTKEECEGAGGTVVALTDCATGSACFRADENHVVHTRCLSKKP